MPRPSFLRSAIRLIRPHQWSKNLLIFVPMAFAHLLGNPVAVLHATIAFFAFSFTASVGYIFNDIQDRERDRLHKTKKHRPLASGAITAPMGGGIALLLLAAAVAMGAYLGRYLLCSMAGYLLLTTAYSRWLKKRVLIDVMLLASLYTSRIIVGSVATQVVPSMWLLSLSMFIFFSLAFVKRLTELMPLHPDKQSGSLHGRDYAYPDSDTLRSMGIAAGTTAVLVLALYIDSAQAANQYANPLWLWPSCAVLWYWISRMWIKTARGEMHDDPIVYSLTDRGSWVSFAAIAFCWVAASLDFEPHLR